MAQTYFAIFTAIGEAKDANAKALGIPMVFTEMAVGDGNGALPVPDRTRTTLVNQVRRAPLNQLSRDPVNTNQVIAEQVIPENVGGWWIREIGLYDADGDLIAIANCPPTYKPQLAEGSGRTQVVRMVLIVSSADTVQLKIDPAVVLATRKYADDAITASMNTHLAAANPHPQYVRKDAAQGLTDAEKHQARRNINAPAGGNVTIVNFAASPIALTADHAGLVLVDATAGNVVINLPAASLFAALPFQFKRVDATANSVTLNRAGTDTIDGVTSVTLSGKDTTVLWLSDSVSKWQTVSATKGIKTFTASGAFTVPAGVSQVYVSMCGGGGGGSGGVITGSADLYAGGGGGGGQCYLKTPVAVTPGQVIAVTVGAAGAAGAGRGHGGAGGASSFGVLLTASGGSGGMYSTISGTGGGFGGPGGQRGGDGTLIATSNQTVGAYGGGTLLGVGGSPTYGGNGGGAGYGAGGAGGPSSGSPVAGGAGAPGVCIVEW